MAAPLSQPAEAQVGATATTAGFGAAFGYAQTVGVVSFSAVGSIGNGTALGWATTPTTNSLAQVITNNNAAAAAQAIGTPFGSTAWVQVISFPGGGAFGLATASP
jgi:hypothetical protein